MIDKFSGQYRFLSNFYEDTNPVQYQGVNFKTAEHAYQAAKCLYTADFLTILNTDKAKAAKKLGRTITIRPDWEQVKYTIMTDIVRSKFYPGRLGNFLTDLLIQTGETELIEGNTWGDTDWGVCGGVGKNNLGKILMMVRTELNDNQSA